MTRRAGTPPYRIVHLLGTSRLGGTERMVLEQVRRTSPQRFLSWVSSIEGGGPLLSLARERGAQASPLLPRGRVPGVALLIARLAGWLRAHRIDLVHLYGLHANVLGRVAARLAGVPGVVAAVRNTDNWRRWHHVLLDRATARWVDRWISNSEAGRAAAITREQVPPSKIVAIPNGVDLERFAGRREEVRARLRAALGLSPDIAVALCVANIRPHKGHFDLLATMECLPESRVVLLMLGEDLTGGALRQEIGRRQLAEQVRVLGFVDDVVPYYSASDVLVHAAWWEGMPNVVLEAMAMGLPVVATAVGDVPRLVTDGVSGRLVPPRVPAAFADALRRLLADPEGQVRMGCEGRRRAEAEFSLDRMVQRIEAVYCKVLEGAV